MQLAAAGRMGSTKVHFHCPFEGKMKILNTVIPNCWKSHALAQMVLMSDKISSF